MYTCFQQSIHDAIIGRDFELLRTVIEQSDDTKYIRVAFAIAASTNQLDMLKRLIDYNKSCHWKRQVHCLLHEEEVLSNLDALRLLLREGADVNEINMQGYTPLHRACDSNRHDAVELLLSAGADAEAKTKYGLTGLHIGILNKKYIRVVEILLSAGVDVKAKTQNGQTALHYAVRMGHIELVKRLLELGIEITDCDSNGETAIHQASSYDWPSVLELLIERLALDFAKSLNQCEQSFAVKKALADFINRPAQYGWTALHLCVMRRSYWLSEVMRTLDLLLDNGADVDATDVSGNTALHELFETDMPANILEFMLKLIEHGANPDARNKHGQTPLFMTDSSQENNAIRKFTQIISDVNCYDLDGDTALHVYCLLENPGAKVLLEAGADITICNRRGQSPMIIVESHLDEIQIRREDWTTSMILRLIELDLAGLLRASYPAGCCAGHFEEEFGSIFPDLAKGPEFNEKRADCKADIELLKSHLVRPGLSIFDWLTKYRLSRPLYAQDAQLIGKLDSIDWQLYPNYAQIIRGHIRSDKYKAKTMTDARASFVCLIKLARPANEQKRLPRLPEELCDLILAQCNQCELCMFVQEFKRLDLRLKMVVQTGNQPASR